MLIGEIEEIYEALTHNGEIAFDYKNNSYAITTAVWENQKYVSIWTDNFEGNNVCLAKEKSFLEMKNSKEVVDKILNTKCFDGKSFLEIEPYAELTTINGL